MVRRWFYTLFVALTAWLLASVGVGTWWLPGMLLNAPVPQRTEAFQKRAQLELERSGGSLSKVRIEGGEGRILELWHLRRKAPKGAVIYLHGFRDDVWGTLGRARSLPEWDAVGFTFRGRDRDPSTPCTLGGWERRDVVAAFHHLEQVGFAPDRILIAGWSMGAGVALLAMEDLEREGKRPGGALLECPFEDLRQAARDHVRGTLGRLELLARLAERIGIRKAGRLAAFDPATVSPAEASGQVGSRVARFTVSASILEPSLDPGA